MSTYANEMRKAALDGMVALLADGDVIFQAAGPVELAVLPVSWAAATTANPSTSLGTCTADTTVTAGTITLYALRTSGGLVRINGTVGTSAANLIVTNNVVPVGATEVSCTGGLTLSLQLSTV